MENVINHANILYVRDISQLGGVETYVYEMVKKYKDLDIAVVYKSADAKQLKRIKKYCRAYRHTNQKIICKVAIINYDTSIIDYITEDIWKENAKEDEGIYQVVHGDYEHVAYSWKPPTDNRIKTYIGITKHIVESFKRITGNKNVILGYNPLTIEKENKKLVLVSATRLSKIKGKDRMIKLVNALDNARIDYIWYIFTNDTNAIPSDNVVYMKPRLDVSYWINQADYLVQLSDTEACSYSINEALYRNIPVIVTPLPYLEEIGVKDNENAYIMKFDCSNICDIIKKITNIPKFKFLKLKDNYINILAESKSRYEEEKNMKVKVRALPNFEGIKDAERNVYPKAGDEWITEQERAEFLQSKKVVEIIEVIQEKPITEKTTKKVEEVKEEEKPKRTTRRRKSVAKK